MTLLPMILALLCEAQDDARRELAQQLSNPLAPLVGVQLQSDLEWGAAFQATTTLQPVLPIPIADAWNLVARSSFSVVYAREQRSGLANTTASLFLSPRTTRIVGLTWGVGPIVALPATTAQLGARHLGLGPTVAIIHTVGPVTYGVLIEQVWFAGGADDHIYLQPQAAWTMSRAGTSLRARSETTYAWSAHRWTVPVIVDVAQVVEVGQLALEISLGPIVYLARSDDTPRWGARASATIVAW